MNLKKWTSAVTLCAVTFAASCAGLAPAQAADDTASVGDVTPNLQAAAQALNAANQHLNGGNSGSNSNNSGSNKPSGGTDTQGFDYVTLENPAVTYDGQVYLPLRSTFKLMKGEALEPTWKPEGQNKMKLTGSKGSYELYLTADGNGIQIQKGGTTYPLKAVNGVTYVTLSFFQAMIQAANVGLSGDNLLILEAKNGANSVWNSGVKAVNGVTYVTLSFFQAMIQAANVGLSGDNLLILEAKNGANSVWNSGVSFWTTMNTYTAPVTQPETKPVEPQGPNVTLPNVDTPQKPSQPSTPQPPSKPSPDITLPEVDQPSKPQPTPPAPKPPTNNGGTTNKPSGSIGTSKVPVKVQPGGNGLIAQPSKPQPTPPAPKPPTNNGGTTNKPSGSIGTSKVPVKVQPGGNGLIADTLFWPTSVTYVSSLYGYRIDPVGGIVGDFHLGVDIAGPVGTPIYAAQGGKVIRASWFSTYGNCIDIQHPSGLVTRYAHLSSYNVSVGDTVKQGQTIAAMGATGNVTGPHVHFETIINGKTVDPANYLNLKAVM